MKCVFCAFELNDPPVWNFCPSCGASVSGKCRECGEKTVPGAKFCVGCGASLRRMFAIKIADGITLTIDSRAAVEGSVAGSREADDRGAGAETDSGAFSSAGNGFDKQRALDLNSFNQSETPDFLKNISARGAEANNAETQRQADKPSDGGRLDFRSFNEAATPDFLSEIIKKGKPPLFDLKYEEISASEKKEERPEYKKERKPKKETIKEPVEEYDKNDKNKEFNKELNQKDANESKAKESKNKELNAERNETDNETARVPAAPPDATPELSAQRQATTADKPSFGTPPPANEEMKDSAAPAPPEAEQRTHSFDKFKVSSRIDSILKDDERKISTWGIGAAKKQAATPRPPDAATPEQLTSENHFVEPPAPVDEKEKKSNQSVIEVKLPREEHTGRVEPSKLSVKKLLAVDSGNNRLQFVSSDAKFISSFGTRGCGCSQFDNPQKAVIDALGNIYVSDFSNNRVQKFTPDGQFILSFGSHGGKNGEFNYPCGLAFSREGLLFVVDSYNNRVQIFDCDGKYVSKFEGAEIASDIQLDTPTDIAVDSSNNIYVCDTGNNRVIKFDPKWRKLYELGIPDRKMQGFDSPSAIAIDSSDNLVVADTGNHLIKLFDCTGGLLLSFGSKGQKEGKLDSPGSVECDSDGNIYVADTWNNRIQIFSADGKFIRAIGSYGSDPGKFNHINDVVVLGTLE